jgi:hypothetical protein
VRTLQDPHHLYFLFDLMSGGDLMDVLVAEAKIIKFPVPQKGSVRQGLLAPKVKMWQVRTRTRAALAPRAHWHLQKHWSMLIVGPPSDRGMSLQGSGPIPPRGCL